MCKLAQTKSHDPHSTSCHLASPPHCERKSHSLYHADIRSVVALAAALAAAPHLVHPVMMVITMIAVAANPLVHAMTTTSGIMISQPTLQNDFLNVQLESIVVLTAPLSRMAKGCPNIPDIEHRT